MPATTTDERLLVNAEELSRLTGWSRQSIYRRARRGELPCVRLGAREVKFDLDAVRRYLGANLTVSPRGQQ